MRNENQDRWWKFVEWGYEKYLHEVAGQALGSTAKGYAEWLGVAASYISRWKSGEINPPEGEVLDRVAARLGTRAYLAAGQPIKVPNSSEVMTAAKALFNMKPETRQKAAHFLDITDDWPPELQEAFFDWIIREGERAEQERAKSQQVTGFSFPALQISG